MAFKGCTPAYISRIESGHRTPSLQILRELGRHLGVSAEFLATGATFSSDDVDDEFVEAELAAARGDLEAAAELYEKIYRTARHPGRRAKASAGLGKITFLRGNHEDAIDQLERAAADPALLPEDVPAIADALGRAYASTNRFDDALAIFKREYEAARRSGNSFETIRFSVLLANTFIDCSDFAKAHDILSDVLGVARESADPITRARLYWSQARLHSSEGEPHAAARYARLALATLEATEHTTQIARALLLLAHLENDRGNPAEALLLYEQGHDAVYAAGNRYDEGLFLLEKARAQAATGELEQAASTALGTIPLLQDASPTNLGRGYALAASVFNTLGDSTKALELYELAADLLEAGDRHLVDAYQAMAAIKEAQGHTEEALDLLKLALSKKAMSQQQTSSQG
jgi:tetratricopeptide (TPR) repeat protein